MSQSHKGSRLILQDQTIPVPFESAHFNFNEDAVGIQYGDLVQPNTGGIYTMREDGKFGKAVAVEEATTNLVTGTLTSYSPYHSISKDSDNNVVMTMTSGGADYLTIHNGTNYSGNTISLSGYIKKNGEPHILPGSKANTYHASNASKWEFDLNTGYFEIVQYCSSDSIWLFHTQSGAVDYDVVTIDNFQVEIKTFATSFVNGTRGIGKLHYSAEELLSLDEGTISCWFNPSSGFFIGSWNAIIAHSSDSADHSTIQISRGNTTDKIAVPLANQANAPLGGDWQLIQSSTSVIVGNWYMITASWKRSTGEVKLYINGILEDSTSGQLSSGFPSVLGVISVGSHPYYGSRLVNGLIDELIINKYMATDEEILSWYIANKSFYNPYDYRSYTV